MAEKKSAKKKTARKKPSTAKKAAAKKTASRTAAKKTASRKTAPKTAPKKAAAKKAATQKKAAARKAPASKGARKAAKKAAKAAKKSGKTEKPKASDLIKRASHTPAVFKPASKRPAHILFTMDDIREVLRKRAREENLQKQKNDPPNNGNNSGGSRAAVGETTPAQQKSRHHAASIDDILGLSPSGPQGKSGPGNVPRKFQKYHRLLLELRDEVRNELNLHSSDTLKRSQKEDAGDIAISVDAGTDNFDRDFALSLLSSEQEALNEIEAAIQRIYNGTYGICEVTGEPIKAERLEAVPFTRFSVEGQKQYELNARKRVSRAGAFLNESSGDKISFGDDDSDT